MKQSTIYLHPFVALVVVVEELISHTPLCPIRRGTRNQTSQACPRHERPFTTPMSDFQLPTFGIRHKRTPKQPHHLRSTTWTAR